MKIALTHYYDEEHILLEKENTTLEEIIRSIAKILTIEAEIEESSSMATERVSRLLINNYNFVSDLKKYKYEEIEKLGKVKEVDFRNIVEVQNQEVIYILDAYELWEAYLCLNYENLDKEIEENKDNLTKKLYQEIHKMIIEDRTAFFNWCLDNLEKNYKVVLKMRK